MILFDNGSFLQADLSGNITLFNSSGVAQFTISPSGKVITQNGISTAGIGGGGIILVANTSSGLTGGGNLNPSFTPTANADVWYQGTLDVTSYSSGSVGVALNAVYSTAGASATNFNSLVRRINGGSGGNISSTAAAAGIYSFFLHAKTSGGKAIQPKTTVGGGNSLKYTIDWELVEYQ